MNGPPGFVGGPPAEQIELVALAELFEFDLDDDEGGVVVEIVVAAVTAEGDEVIAAAGLVSLQIARHEVMVLCRDW